MIRMKCVGTNEDKNEKADRLFDGLIEVWGTKIRWERRESKRSARAKNYRYYAYQVKRVITLPCIVNTQSMNIEITIFRNVLSSLEIR